jgi:Ni,Fe-hydrogenase I small subunit
MGMSQIDLAKVTEAFAHGSAWSTGGWMNKPKVIWVHGAECTGCSTSLLSLFEDVRGKAIEGASYTTLAALDLAVGGDGTGGKVLSASTGHPFGHRTLQNSASVTGCDFDGGANGANGAYIANIADVLIDFIDLQYHETVMGMGADMAYKWLNDAMYTADATPFVLVVEGAVQPKTKNGYWGAAGTTPWCSIGMPEAGGTELSFDDVVRQLAVKANCAAVVAIGQCAAFGGYPACESPVLKNDAKGKANGGSMTGAMGVYDFLVFSGQTAAANKVIAVPGCPTNPWWFILTVVAWLVDFTNGPGAGTPADGPLGILKANGSISGAAVDGSRRLKAVYGQTLHGPFCKRYQSFLDGVFATKPGDPGCLQLLGCKGTQTMTLCGRHGWNSQQPRNDSTFEHGVAAINNRTSGAGTSVFGGNCTAAGHPCMGCTEQGYPDAFLPFVIR